MRVKLRFDSSLQLGQRHKVCFYIADDSCQKVADLSYLIQKRYWDKSVGTLSLFLDDFYIPPGENIDIIKENDVLSVQLSSFDQPGKVKRTNRKKTSSSSSSSSSSSEEEPKKKRLRIDTQTKNNNKVNGNVKKIIPLSKLGISKKKVMESSSSSSSSSSSESDSEEDVPRNKQKKKQTSDESAKNKISKQTTNIAQKKQVVKIDSSSSSDTSSESDSSDDGTVEKTNQIISYAKEDTNVDFDIQGLSSNATSTPGVNSIPRKKSILKTPVSNENSFGKRVAAKDKYKNVSEVFTYTPPIDKNANKSTKHRPNTVNIASPKNSNTEKSVNGTSHNASTSLMTSQNSSASLVNTSDSKQVSGKTLRNRRRRQRRIEQNRTGRNKNKENGIDVSQIANAEAESKSEDATEKFEEKKPQQTEQVTEEQQVPQMKKYEKFTVLQECPAPDSVIAFKVWDMDDAYQPFVSDYKEAKVVSYDKLKDQVELAMCEGFCVNEKRNGRFEMDVDNSEVEMEEKDELKATSNVTQDWKSLLEPRLLEVFEF